MGEVERGIKLGNTLVKIGTCGFPRSRKVVYEGVDAVEIQESFYNLLTNRKIESILRSKPPGFSITMKAWQATTHPSSSPTWRRMKSKPKGDLKNYGWMRCTKENLDALRKTVEQAKKLKAEVIVFQTPSSMPLTKEHVGEVLKFLSQALELAGEDLKVAWEPRGEWVNRNDVLSEAEEEGVIIIYDALRRNCIRVSQGIGYTRLHGLGSREVNYKYKYTDEDLIKLKELINKTAQEGASRIYVMFNNVYMLDDAIRLRRMLEED